MINIVEIGAFLAHALTLARDGIQPSDFLKMLNLKISEDALRAIDTGIVLIQHDRAESRFWIEVNGVLARLVDEGLL